MRSGEPKKRSIKTLGMLIYDSGNNFPHKLNLDSNYKKFIYKQPKYFDTCIILMNK